MSRPVLCCDDCFEIIASQSTNAARWWMDLCKIQASCQCFALKVHDNKEFNLLERLGFITTTDLPEHIVIKVHGLTREEEGDFFCIGRCSNGLFKEVQ